ncbi:hypothetical protein MMC34_002663 [Xylographa carneopallida]|nr:hypothetical protein [Xylographa carneopallida]
MLPLIGFVELLAEDAEGLVMSTFGEHVLPDRSLTAFAGFNAKIRLPVLEDIALSANFVIDLLAPNRATLKVMKLRNVYLIDGTWEGVLQTTDGFDLLQPRCCYLKELRYARKGASSDWRNDAAPGSKLYSSREADRGALKAFEKMLKKNAGKSFEPWMGPLPLRFSSC